MDSEINKEIKQLTNEMMSERYKTALKKVNFANEIKNGLGAEIKQNPRKIKIMKESRGSKFKAWLRDIFTKF